MHSDPRHFAQDLTGEGVKQGQGFDLVIEQLYAYGLTLGLGRVDVNNVAAYAIGGAVQFHLVTGVLHLRQTPQEITLVHLVAAVQVHDHLQIGLWIAEAVDGGDGGDDDAVMAFQQGLGGGQAHLLDVLVDRCVLFYIGVRAGDVGLGLVIIVIGDEVLYGAVGEKLTELPVELRRQGLVRRQHQRRPLHGLDDIGNGEGLAGSGDAQQDLVCQAAVQPV